MTSSSTSERHGILVMLALAFLLLSWAPAPSVSAQPVFESVNVPLEASTGHPVNISVHVVSGLPLRQVQVGYFRSGDNFPAYGYMNLTDGNVTDGTWSFTLPAQEWACTYEVWLVASDISGASTKYPAGDSNIEIEVTGKSPPRPFPWGTVFMVGFLAVVLVLTELIFKPGFYRPTGRERARMLEEEDRRKQDGEKHREE